MDRASCAAAREVLWAGNRSARLRRDDPASWVGPFGADDSTAPDQLFGRATAGTTARAAASRL